MDNIKYKHIIWDWNGTLLDDAWLCVNIMNEMLIRRGLPGLTRERYQRLFDFPVIDYYRRLGFDFDKEPFEISGTEFIEMYEKRRHEIALREGVHKILKSIKNLGITQSILSAYRQDTLDELTSHFDIRHYFLKIIGLDNHYAHGKIDNGKRWMEELHYDSQDVLFVGDTVHDHEVANAIGVNCVLIPSGHHTEQKLKKCGVPVLDSLFDILTMRN